MPGRPSTLQLFIRNVKGEFGIGDINLDCVTIGHHRQRSAVGCLRGDMPHGTSLEFILGLHGELEYDGEQLAGMYAHDQVRMAEKAGVNIYGPVVNIKPSRSVAWNLSRAIVFTKACCGQ